MRTLSLYFITHPDKIETLWNKEYLAPLASLVNFHMEEEGGRGGVDILKFGQNPEICLKFWNLGYDQLELGWYLHQLETHQLSQPIALDCPIVIISKDGVGIFISQSHIS